MPQRKVRLRFPLAGVDRATGYQTQPPYTTPDALNVRGFGPEEGRARGGSRPGLIRAVSGDAGAGSCSYAVRMLAAPRVSTTGVPRVWEDDFSLPDIAEVWEAASWWTGITGSETYTTPTKTRYDSVYASGVTYDPEKVALQRTLIELENDYEVCLLISPVGHQISAKFYLFIKLDDTSPDGAQGCELLRITLSSETGLYSWARYEGSGGSYTQKDSGGGSGVLRRAYRLRARVDESDNYRTKWYLDDTLLSESTGISGAGQRIAFAIDADSPGYGAVDAVILQDFPSSIASRRVLVSSVNGKVYKQEQSVCGAMSIVSSDTTDLATDRRIRAADLGGYLYIADYRDPDVGWRGARFLAKTRVVKPTGGSTDGITTSHRALVIAGTGVELLSPEQEPRPLAVKSYGITYVDADGVVIDSQMEAADGSGVDEGTLDVVFLPDTDDSTRPKRLNISSSSPTMETWAATAGEVPSACQLICTYRDCIVLAAPMYGESQWFMSRQGDPLDWDYSQEDAGAAIAGNMAEAGQIGDNIRALIPFSDDYLVFGCQSSLWVMRGHPRAGGVIDNISDAIGICAPDAWCRGVSGELYFLSTNGMFLLPPGANQQPALVSARLPRELASIAEAGHDVMMAYDTRRHAVLIFTTPPAHADNATHWWFDVQLGAFWPFQFGHSMFQPTALVNYVGPSDVESGVILGTTNGRLLRFSESVHGDDTYAFSSHVLYGPLRPGRAEDVDGVLARMDVELAARSGNVNWSVSTGQTAAEAIDAAAVTSGTATAGLNRTADLRARGPVAYVQFASGGWHPWTIESAILTMLPGGKRRVP